ncbi:MerR family transcriptional regulator [Caminicella sporogenes]|uniref:MerR family transcriptional regulator n=1 Tax=Caminicella sporogenes TaxID=166485 RepID=UPI0025417559|nr:MerR family transcriptional regulator [Caminicella sporogenes]WIF94711.1 MerR family transcriptional regulator [Caminicella sporogenes]
MYNNKKEFTISEASKITGFSNHVLRYYEKEFEIDVPRNKSGHRYYTNLELEKFLYIRNLKENGFSNTQIKAVLKSPEKIILNNEIAASQIQECELSTEKKNLSDQNNDNREISLHKIKEIISREIDDGIKTLSQNLIEEMQTVFGDIKKNNEEYKNNDKDALISENARLRMKLKEKAYELAILKEKLKRLENSKKSIFAKIFSNKKD